MKKIISLALALGLFVGATAQNAQASVTASGYFMITGDALNNAALVEKDADTTLMFNERVQIALDMDMGEDVTGQLSLRIPHKKQFGNGITGVEDDFALQLRTAYINFPVAMLNVTAGLQGYALPSYLGSGVNPILDANLPGFVVSADFGMIAPELAWFVTGYDTDKQTKQNVYALSLPVALGDGMALTPWATMIDNSGAPSDTFMGATFDAALGNISAGAGVVYGMTDSEASISSLLVEGHFAIDLGALTPGIAAWYGMAGADGAVAATGYGSWGAFNGTGDYLFGNQNGLQATPLESDPFSTLGVAATVANIQLGEAMDLNARVIYAMDTAEGSEGKDLEIGAALNTALTSNLNIVVDAAYLMPMVEGQGNAASVACTFVANF